MVELYKNIFYMIKFAFYLVCLYYYDYLVEKNKAAPILINLLGASLLSAMLFYSAL